MVFCRHLLELFINPYFLTLIFLASFIGILWRKQGFTWLCTGLLTGWVILVTLSTGWLAKNMTNYMENQYPSIGIPDPKIHWVVVLGGGQWDSAHDKPSLMRLSSATLKRLLEGIRLYRQLPQAKLVLSGGGYDIDVSEAERMQEVAEWLNVPKKDMVLETHSNNTADEALAFHDILQTQPFYLVTSAVHMSRSMALCEAQELHPIAAPTDYTYHWDHHFERMIVPNGANLLYLDIVLHELLGRIWAVFHNNYHAMPQISTQFKQNSVK